MSIERSTESMKEVLSVNETLPADKTAPGQNSVQSESDRPKKFVGKKWGIIGVIAVVLLALIVGVSIYNTPENRLSRQLDLGNRYLEEQNYAQAIIEFDKAIAIDPMCVEAYLGKAEAYIGLGDLQSALSTLQTGYELTNDGRLREKIDEIEEELVRQEQAEEEAQRAAEGADGLVDAEALSRADSEDGEDAEISEAGEEQEDDEQLPEGDYLELPFRLSDITIMGYDLFEPHLYEVADALGCPMNERIETDDGNKYESMSAEEGGTWNGSEIVGSVSYYFEKYVEEYGMGDCWYTVYQDGEISLEMVYDNSAFMESSYNSPVYLGTSYNEMCKNLGIDMIKNKVEGQPKEFSQGDSSFTGMVYGDGSLYVKDDTGLYKVYYFERNHIVDWFIMICGLYLENCDGGTDFYIETAIQAESDPFAAGFNRSNFDYVAEYVNERGGCRCRDILYVSGSVCPWELADYVDIN